MVADVHGLIDELISTDESVRQILASDGEPCTTTLSGLDRRYQALFDALMNTEIIWPDQRMARVQFLLAQVSKQLDGGQFLDTLTNGILADVQYLSEKATENQEPLQNPGAGERAVNIVAMRP